MHCYFNGSFLERSGKRYFTLLLVFPRKWFWQELIFGMTTMAFALGKPNTTVVNILTWNLNKLI